MTTTDQLAAQAQVRAQIGGEAWLAVKENEPAVFEAMKQREAEWGHTFLGDISLAQLSVRGMKRTVRRKEAIDRS